MLIGINPRSLLHASGPWGGGWKYRQAESPAVEKIIEDLDQLPSVDMSVGVMRLQFGQKGCTCNLFNI